MLSATMDWSAAISQHQAWLRSSLFARLGDTQAVDEVMQEVSLAAFSKGNPLQEPEKVGAWLYRVALKQSFLFKRRKGRHQKLLDRLAGQNPVPAETTSPLDFLLRRERGQMVQNALAQLDHRDVEILLWRYSLDLSCREMALRLGIGESCLMVRLHRARERLRRILQSDCAP